MSTRLITKKSLQCNSCNSIEDVDSNIKSVTCWRCVAKQVAPPTNPYKKKESTDTGETIDTVSNLPSKIIIPGSDKFPRCWWLKVKYISEDGRIFNKGKEVLPDEVDKIYVEKPIKPESETKSWGRGWHLKKNFIAPDGRKFIRGIEQK